MKLRNHKRKINFLPLGGIGLVMLTLTSCMGEVSDKLKEAKQGVSNASTWIDQAQQAEGKIERLKEMEPLNNEQLKKWLPEKIGELKRTGFKVGKTGFINVASIEGKYKTEDGREFELEIMDGAGEMGSVLMTSMSMASTMEIEEEDENKHMQTVTKDGIRAKQTYFKKRNKTELQFVYGERFIVMVKAKDAEPEKTWELVERSNLDGLLD